MKLKQFTIMTSLEPDPHYYEAADNCWKNLSWYCPYCNIMYSGSEYRGIENVYCNICSNRLVRKDKDEFGEIFFLDRCDVKIWFPEHLFKAYNVFQLIINDVTYEISRSGLYNVPRGSRNIRIRSKMTGGYGELEDINYECDHLYCVDWNKIDGGLVIPKLY